MSKKENPVDYVLDRMVEAVLGENAHFKSHAEVLGVPPETIKTWRRRREVPPGKLAAFSVDWKVSVDWLLHGGDRATAKEVAHRAGQSVKPYGLSKDELKLLENYRHSPHEVQEALQVVASIASRPAPVAVRVPKMRSGGPVERVPPVMRSGEVSKTKPARRKTRKGGESA